MVGTGVTLALPREKHEAVDLGQQVVGRHEALHGGHHCRVEHIEHIRLELPLGQCRVGERFELGVSLLVAPSEIGGVRGHAVESGEIGELGPLAVELAHRDRPDLVVVPGGEQPQRRLDGAGPGGGRRRLGLRKARPLIAGIDDLHHHGDASKDCDSAGAEASRHQHEGEQGRKIARRPDHPPGRAKHRGEVQHFGGQRDAAEFGLAEHELVRSGERRHRHHDDEQRQPARRNQRLEAPRRDEQAEHQQRHDAEAGKHLPLIVARSGRQAGQQA